MQCLKRLGRRGSRRIRSRRSTSNRPQSSLHVMRTIATAQLGFLAMLHMGAHAIAAESTAATVRPVVVVTNTTDVTSVSPVPIESPLVENDATLVVSPCYWDGVAPFCNGACPYGYIDCGRSYRGDGRRCVTGIKVWCCREGSGECG
ncbi:hypothetical protein C8Q70DRAFT_44250 [Cubamyces menziesii]|nr:hypothetical protein C8Q70DRAFT_44250 [Cubamyces menziesii]